MKGDWNRMKTHCKKGHPFSPENTAHYPSIPGVRRCKECHRQAQRKRYGWEERKVLQPDPSVVKIQIVTKRCDACLGLFTGSHRVHEHPECPVLARFATPNARTPAEGTSERAA
jgi:hypothetical protein